MGTEQNRHDDAVDKVLAAMRDAAPSEGLDARIAQRLHQHAAAAPQRSHLPANSTLTGTWWRGAFSGAAATTLAVALLLVAGHLLRQHTNRQQLVASKATPAPSYVAASTSGVAQATPCTHQTLLRARSTARPPDEQRLVAKTRIGTSAPSRPAPVRPLTAQELALVELARTADPKMLAALAPETQAKVEAQEEENFKKFFASPPAPQQSVEREPATKPNESQPLL
jgi:hypothetical protein